MQDPSEIASKDQTLAAISDMAGLLFEFNKALKDKGFTPSEALALTSAYLQAVYQSTTQKRPQ